MQTAKKTKSSPPAQAPRQKIRDVKVSDAKPIVAAIKASAPAALADVSKEELDKMLQARFERAAGIV
jgi:hypothetical protein